MSSRHRASRASRAPRHGVAAARRPNLAARADSQRPPSTARRVAVVAAVCAVMASAAVTTSALGDPASTVSPKIIAQDAFDRVTSSGLGAADIGGVYESTTQAASTAVSTGAARVDGLKTGGTFRATLPAVQAVNQKLSLSFALPRLPSNGRGLTLALILRRTADGSEYDAKARILPSGAVMLSFSRRDTTHTERFLDTEVAAAPIIKPGQEVTFDADVNGTDTVQLRSHVWIMGSAIPAYQVSASDHSARRITDGGALGVRAYVSRSTAPVSTNLTDLIGWDLTPSGESGATATTSATPSSSAPSAGSATVTSTSPTRTPTATTTAATTTAASTSAPPSSTSATSSSQVPTPSVTPTPTWPRPHAPDGSDAGAVALGSTAYPVPAASLYVAASGSDSNPGSYGAPLRTLARAIAVASPGTTIALRSGTYHESVEVPANKPSLTIESAPNEAVRLDGSTPVGNWSKQGATWISSGWTAKFDSTPGYDDAAAVAQGWSWLNPAYPMAAHPDQMWLNGKKLAQVATQAAVTAGTFYADYSGSRLVIGDDPSGREVRASDLALAITVRSTNTQIRGLGVQRYATPVREMGAVRLDGSGDKIENVSVTDVATTGITVENSNVTVNHVSLVGNGLLGMHTNYSDNLRVESALVVGNNSEHFNQAPVAGGIKITKSRTLTVDNSVIENNSATGLWMDCSSYDGTFTNNIVSNNSGHGIFYEISSKAIIANNVVALNGGDGLKINNSDQVRIWNNTITGNGRNIELVQDSRLAAHLNDYGHDPRQPIPDPTVSWLMKDVQVMNNVLSVGAGYNIYARDHTNKRTATEMNLKINGNLFSTSPSAAQAQLIWSGANGALTTCLTVADIARTGTGGNNIEASGAASLLPRAAAIAEPLPADIAALIGQSAATRYIGAF